MGECCKTLMQYLFPPTKRLMILLSLKNWNLFLSICSTLQDYCKYISTNQKTNDPFIFEELKPISLYMFNITRLLHIYLTWEWKVYSQCYFQVNILYSWKVHTSMRLLRYPNRDYIQLKQGFSKWLWYIFIFSKAYDRVSWMC